MKKVNYNYLSSSILFVSVLMTTIACYHAGKSRTIIATNDNGNIKRIEYSGTVVFNQEKTGVEYLSDGAFLKFEHNGQKIEAESDHHGKIKYEYNGDEVTRLDEPAKKLLAEAVQAVVAQQAKVKAEQGR